MKIEKLDDLKHIKGKLNSLELFRLLKQFIPEKKYTRFIENFKNYGEFHHLIKQYDVIKGHTYLDALFKLRQSSTSYQPKLILSDGSAIYRPFTKKENMVARIDDSELFKKFLHSCTGNAYKKRTNLMKTSPICKEIITLDKDFSGSYLMVDYDNFDGEEIDVTKTSERDKSLTSMGGREDKENIEVYDCHKLKLIEYRKNYFGRRVTFNEQKNLMRYYTREQRPDNQLRALVILSGGDNDSDINYDDRLDDRAQFARVMASETHNDN